MLRSLELFPPLSQPCSQARPPPSVPESPLPPPLPPQRALTLWSWPQESHPNGHQLPEPNSQSVQPKLQSFLRAAGAVLPSRGDIANPSLPPAQTTAVFSFQWREDHTHTLLQTHRLLKLITDPTCSFLQDVFSGLRRFLEMFDSTEYLSCLNLSAIVRVNTSVIV